MFMCFWEINGVLKGHFVGRLLCLDMLRLKHNMVKVTRSFYKVVLLP